ncbi:MAG: septum site-determining protein MinC [Nodosilinea sp.]
MVSESPSTPVTDLPPQGPESLVAEQVHLKNEDGQLVLVLPSSQQASPAEWGELLQQVRQRLEASERLWQAHTPLRLQAGDRLLDIRQLQSLVDTLGEAQLILSRVVTSRRQTAIAAITLGCSVDQLVDMEHLNQSTPTPGQPLAAPLYLQTTVRSGVDIRHPGTIMILGDTNPGSSLVADGDIVVWGRLRGLAHAGASGNRQCRIMALQMQPTQLRIADLVARPPDSATTQYGPEVAYIGDNQGIRIALAEDFMRHQLSPRGLGFEP